VSRASPITSATAMAGLDANGARVFVRHCGHVGQQTGRLAAPASPGRYRDFTAATVIVSEIVLVFFIVIVINSLAG